MPYTLEWLRGRKLVKVKRFGQVTVDEIQGSLSDIGRETGSAERPYVLVDVRAATTYPSIGSMYAVAETNVYRPRVGLKTAFVFNEETADVIEFVVLAGSNRGFSIQAFTEEDAAIDWLFSASPTTKNPGSMR